MKNAAVYLLCFILFPILPSQADIQYQIAELPTPTAVETVSALGATGVFNLPAVNASRQVALTFQTAEGAFRPYMFSDGNLIALPLPANAVGAAISGMNDHGQVVGFAIDINGAAHPVMWQAGSVMNLDQGGNLQGAAWSINDGGQISGMVGNYFGEVGLYGGAGASSMAAIWSAGVISTSKIMTEQQGSASAINNSGQAVVTSFSPITGSTTVTVSDHDNIAAIGEFGGYHLEGRDINDHQQIVGSGSNDAGESIAYLWDNGTFCTLAPLSADLTAIPWSINDIGAIVGQSFGASGPRAVLWQDGQAIDLNTLISGGAGWQLINATDIANDGTIVGTGIVNGQLEAFLLTPVSSGDSSTLIPEPASAGVLLLGGMFLLRRSGRRNKIY